MARITWRSVIKAMIFIVVPPRRWQGRGSTSYMWRIRSAQRFGAAFRSGESASLATEPFAEVVAVCEACPLAASRAPFAREALA